MDAAVLVGAWIFFVLLLMAIANQWMTLGAINAEIIRQKKKVAHDFASSSALFEDDLPVIVALVVAALIGLIWVRSKLQSKD